MAESGVLAAPEALAEAGALLGPGLFDCPRVVCRGPLVRFPRRCGAIVFVPSVWTPDAEIIIAE